MIQLFYWCWWRWVYYNLVKERKFIIILSPYQSIHYSYSWDNWYKYYSCFSFPPKLGQCTFFFLVTISCKFAICFSFFKTKNPIYFGVLQILSFTGPHILRTILCVYINPWVSYSLILLIHLCPTCQRGSIRFLRSGLVRLFLNIRWFPKIITCYLKIYIIIYITYICYLYVILYVIFT